MANILSFFACWLILITVACTAYAAAPSKPPQSASRAALEDVLKRPQDERTFRRYLKSLPKVALPGGTNRYVVEGDLLLTEQQVREHLGVITSRAKALQGGLRPELIVNEVAGKPDYWDTVASRQLTYAIDRRTFSPDEYALVQESFAKAGKEWIDACPDCRVSLSHQAQFDSSPTLKDVTFIVRGVNARGSFIAAAFFPSWSQDSYYVNVDKTYFTSKEFDKVGVFRHELGHVLGYRHEHTRGIAGCFYEDAKWIPLTAYDSQSVMHYPCGEVGSSKLELTDIDRAGHRKQYKLAQEVGHMPALSGQAPPQYVVRLEGGEVADNLFGALAKLAAAGQLPIREVAVEEGQSACKLIRLALNLPERVHCRKQAIEALWLSMNGPKVSVDNLRVGQKVSVPDGIQISPYKFPKSFVADDATARAKNADVKKNWLPWLAAQESVPGLNKLTFHGYEVKIPVLETSKVPETMKSLDIYASENFFLGVVGYAKPAEQRYYSMSNRYPADCLTDSPPPLAYYAELSFAKGLPECAARPCSGGNCAEVFLVDKPVADHPKLLRTAGATAAPGTCRYINVWNDAYHGTHLAGIIAASHTHPYGVVGLSPVANFKPYKMPMDNIDLELSSFVSEWTTDTVTYPGLKILAFASKFETRQGIGPRFAHVDQRFTSVFAKQIRDSADLLLVVAAGQGASYAAIYHDGIDFPRNLGDQSNVIVVTACTQCAQPVANLMTNANFGVKLSRDGAMMTTVHLAAPGGEPIVGLVNADPSVVVNGIGTSQAAAFVAGTAAAMVNCYPERYKVAKNVKRQLLVTSRPSLKIADQEKVATGVLDYELALRDPLADWYLGIGSNDRLAITVAGWCQAILDFKDSMATTRLTSSQVRRIYRHEDEFGEPIWYVYVAEAGSTGNIVKYGPGKFVMTANDAPLARLGDGTLVRASSLADLLLSAKPRQAVACAQGDI